MGKIAENWKKSPKIGYNRAKIGNNRAKIGKNRRNSPKISIPTLAPLIQLAS
jgi:hypothetical protein